MRRVFCSAFNAAEAGPREDRSVDVLNSALTTIQAEFIKKLEIGESFPVGKIYNMLNKINGVQDTTSVKVSAKIGGVYSNASLNLDKMLTYDGKNIRAPKNVIFEVKFPIADIKGTIS